MPSRRTSANVSRWTWNTSTARVPSACTTTTRSSTTRPCSRC
jgi:hypothetical protein